MKILVKAWFDIYHSYAVSTYFLLKHLKQYEDMEIYIEPQKYYNPNWEKKYKNDLNLPIYNGESIDIVFSMFFPYIYDTRFADIPQIIFYTQELPVFQPQYWNLSLHNIKQLTEQKKLFLLTPSTKSAQSLIDLDIPVEVIQHGYDTEVYYPSKINYRKQLNISVKQKVYLNISSMCGNKNLHLLIKAFSNINDDSILILKGINDLYNSQFLFNQLLHKHNITIDPKRIRFIFESLSFKDMNKLYNTGDYYVSCGINEGFDVPIVEAKACSLKVITHLQSPNSHLAELTFLNEEDLKDKLIQIRTKRRSTISKEYDYENITEKIKYFLFKYI